MALGEAVAALGGARLDGKQKVRLDDVTHWGCVCMWVQWHRGMGGGCNAM